MNFDQIIFTAENLPFQIHLLHLSLQFYKEIEYKALKIT